MSPVPAFPPTLPRRLRRLPAALATALWLAGCSLWGGGDQIKADPVEAGPTKDRSQQRVRIYIKGVSGEMKSSASGALELKGLMSRRDASEALIRRVYGRAAAQMQKALQPFGYYHAKVSGELTQEGETFYARFTIDPGEPTRVSTAAVEVSGPGGEDKRVQRALRAFAPAAGGVIEHRIYEASKARIADTLAERGYLDAKLAEHRVTVRLADRSARIALRFDSGPRFQFGPTTVEGSHLPDALVLGYLPYQQGQDYRQDRLVEFQQRLLDADYYSDVEIETDQAQATGQQVPIRVRLKPALRTVYTGGVSFGTDSGFGVQGGLTRRWVNDRGHKFNGRVELGQRLTTAGTQYLIPLPGADRESLSASLSYRDEQTDTSTQQVTQLQLAHQRESDNGSFSYGLGAQSGDFVVGDVPGSSRLVYPEARLTRRSVDDFLAPRSGWALTAEARAAPAGLGGDAAFAQIKAEAKLLRPIGEQDRWFARLALGALWTDDFERMPPQLRFFAGGDRSLRGYGYQALGPLNALGKVGGGRYLAVGSFEYEKHWFGDFGVAGFVDAGNAFNAGSFDLAAGVGVGLRWRSPVGLVRVDLAAPVAGDGSGLRLHLLIGPEL